MRAHLLIVGFALAGLWATSAHAQTGRCDRECLIGISEQYLDALAAKDAKRLTLTTANVKYTENGQRLSLGDGLWNSITARGTYILHTADQTAGQIVTIATMRENGAPMIVAVRLKVDNRRLSEIETIVARSEGGAKNLDTMAKPREAFSRLTPAANRTSRTELVRVANMYFSGMQLNDGKGNIRSPTTAIVSRTDHGRRMRAGRAGQPRPDPKTATSYSGCGPAASSSSRGCCIS